LAPFIFQDGRGGVYPPIIIIRFGDKGKKDTRKELQVKRRVSLDSPEGRKRPSPKKVSLFVKKKQKKNSNYKRGLSIDS
jgi:hypothetical protein